MQGTYAEYVTVPAQWVSRKPANLSYEEAAAVPCAALTAYQTLVERLNIQPGETVLITAAAGGVGSFAVQIAKAKGSHVIATASTRNQDYLRELGAEEIIDYTKDDWVAAVRTRYPDGVDVVFTCIAGETKQQSPKVLRDGGRLAWISGEEKSGPPMERQIQGTYSVGLPKRETLEALTRLIEAGKVKVPIDTIYPLEQAAKAQEQVAAGDFQGKVRAGHVRGKLVIAIPKS
jgi:NADPH:quinone reductase-like Zn-dependent oxidoreductase